MSAIDFRKDLLQETYASAAESGIGKIASFAEIISKYLIECNILPDFVSSFYSGKNGRYSTRVDGYCYDEFDDTLYLIVVDYDALNPDRTLTGSNAGKSFDKLKQFIEASLKTDFRHNIEISTPVYDLVQLIINKITHSISRIRLYLFTEAVKSSQIKEIEQDSFCNIPIEKQIWDIERIYRLCSLDDASDNIEINFLDYTKNGIPCIDAGSIGTDKYKSYLGVISGTVLAEIYHKFGSKLLESNVRAFLSTKVAVNKKIRSTLISAPDMFFAYNNGISVTAKNVKVNRSQQGIFIESATDFQIINGGQTTASILSARDRDKADISKVKVQMKLTDIKESTYDDSVELIKTISRSSNSQNKVSDADFFASHPFHKTMEQISRRLYAPAVFGAQYETKWFYERARGQYLQEQMRLTSAQKKGFQKTIPKDHVITKTDLAKVQNAWLENPHIVSKGAQTNFVNFAELVEKKWEQDSTQFNEKYFKSTVAIYLIFQFLEKEIVKKDWYQGGYRANIIYYTVSLFHYLVRKQFNDMELNLLRIWDKQYVPDAIKIPLILIAQQVLKVITSDARNIENVTQWCKKAECWESVKKINFMINGIDEWLFSREELKEEERSAKKIQKCDNELNAEIKVLEYGAAVWKKLYDFSNSNRDLFKPSDISHLSKAMKIPNKIPNSYESKRLLELLAMAEEEGFVK